MHHAEFIIEGISKVERSEIDKSALLILGVRDGQRLIYCLEGILKLDKIVSENT